ncbi:IS3 family transposase [Persicobacter psychrovividus]|uniref:Transposase n=2 Tax=Persicobacter psychrovividus TaxID=387638 RepID=A0ABN6LB98_9BACT|nr:transposase [Persicobacter psychrovividus]BDC98326.1 transposase [Persicobacter psychrovividus]BDC98663.1 transposase [Persicobacter psychrovividus]BDC99484.1 transposase [Persicobacter psychrovividus]BDD00538.1 transposase [Persicobacter psychrovividus]
MVDEEHADLSIRRQCELLQISRSGWYYKPKGESELNLELMRVIDKEYLEHPFRGVPSMTSFLINDCGYPINKKRIERLYKVMGLRSLLPGPHTSKPSPENKIYPYLLRNLEITHSNQVWETDISYVPIAKGFMYLMAVIDVHSRYIVGWSLSNTMSAEWCRNTIQECINNHGAPEIVNTDQGSQFTSDLFTGYLLGQGVTISMDGKGRATDNIYIERFWRTVKYEDIYLNEYRDGLKLQIGLIEYMNFYNNERRHSSIDEKRPCDLYQSKPHSTTSEAKVSASLESVKGG